MMFPFSAVLGGYPAQNGEWSNFANELVGSSYGDTIGNSVSASVGASLSFSMTINQDASGWTIKSGSATNSCECYYQW